VKLAIVLSVTRCFHIPWMLVSSLIATVELHDMSRFSRQVVTLSVFYVFVYQEFFPE